MFCKTPIETSSLCSLLSSSKTGSPMATSYLFNERSSAEHLIVRLQSCKSHQVALKAESVRLWATKSRTEQGYPTLLHLHCVDLFGAVGLSKGIFGSRLQMWNLCYLL